MARWRGQHLPITDPVAMSKAANRLVVHGACNREFDAPPGRAASGESADCGSAPESDSSIHAQHQRMMRWIQVQADDISHLVDQQRIIG